MATMKIWYDDEGDLLEITSEQTKGYMKDIGDDIWERIDEHGKIIGISILGFKKRLHHKTTEISLPMEVSFSE
ncbi:MAG: DUF2283 domain-containing protein [Ignavibacteriales bacterium]|nr:DUF2283 domain-containing protein [Ignavibacteriales bacterium]